MSISPVRSQPQSISWRPMVSSIASRFSMPRPTSRGSSSGNSSAPWAIPCVSEAMQMPPLRPLACPAIAPASRTTTSRAGSASLASSAAQRPVKPAPTTARSQRSAPVSAGNGPGAPGWSSQKTPGALSRRAWSARPIEVASGAEEYGVMIVTLPGGGLASRLPGRELV